MAGLGEPGSGLQVVVRPEGHHEDVRLVDAGVGGDAARHRVDLRDRLPPEPDAVADGRVGRADRFRRAAAERHVQLLEAEHEGVGAVDEGDVHGVTQLGDETGRELQATESGAEHEDGGAHPRRIPAWV